MNKTLSTSEKLEQITMFLCLPRNTHEERTALADKIAGFFERPIIARDVLGVLEAPGLSVLETEEISGIIYEKLFPFPAAEEKKSVNYLVTAEFSADVRQTFIIRKSISEFLLQLRAENPRYTIIWHLQITAEEAKMLEPKVTTYL